MPNVLTFKIWNVLKVAQTLLDQAMEVQEPLVVEI